jgi:hypothetical protein
MANRGKWAPASKLKKDIDRKKEAEQEAPSVEPETFTFPSLSTVATLLADYCSTTGTGEGLLELGDLIEGSVTSEGGRAHVYTLSMGTSDEVENVEAFGEALAEYLDAVALHKYKGTLAFGLKSLKYSDDYIWEGKGSVTSGRNATLTFEVHCIERKVAANTEAVASSKDSTFSVKIKKEELGKGMQSLGPKSTPGAAARVMMKDHVGAKTSGGIPLVSTYMEKVATKLDPKDKKVQADKKARRKKQDSYSKDPVKILKKVLALPDGEILTAVGTMQYPQLAFLASYLGIRKPVTYEKVLEAVLKRKASAILKGKLVKKGSVQ